MTFALDSRLAADTLPVAALPLCDVLLMNDARYVWLILVPRRPGLTEIADLAEDDRARLWREVDQAAAALRQVAPCDKLNIGALGNIVRQLHVHVVARRVGDDAWPGPVWGYGRAVVHEPNDATARIAALRQHLGNEKARD